MKFSFTVLGTPVPKARARSGKDGRHYTPERTRKYEQHVASIARWHIPPGWLLGGAYRLSVNLYFPDYRGADIDNCKKSIADAMNKIAYDDDRQIMKEGETEKVFGDPNPRAEVTLEYLGPMPKRPGTVERKRKPRASTPARALSRQPSWLRKLIRTTARHAKAMPKPSRPTQTDQTGEGAKGKSRKRRSADLPFS